MRSDTAVLRLPLFVLSVAVSQAFLQPPGLAAHGGRSRVARAARAAGAAPGITMQRAGAEAKPPKEKLQLSPQEQDMVDDFRESLPPLPLFPDREGARVTVGIVDPILKHAPLGEMARARGARVVCVLSAPPEKGGAFMIMRRGEEVYDSVVTVGEGAEGIERAAAELRDLGVSHCLVGCQTGVKVCNELNSALGCAEANEPEGARTQHDKSAVNERLRALNLPAIDELLTHDVEEALQWAEALFRKGRRVVIKPIGSMGSLGVRQCSSADEIRAAFKSLSAWGSIASMSLFMEGGVDKMLVQEYLEGRKFGVQTVSAFGKHYTTSVFGSYVWRASAPGDKVGGLPVTKAWWVIAGDASSPSSGPLAISREELYALVRANNKALDAMGVRHGACHNEVMVNHKGEFCVVDPNVRPVGNGLVELEHHGVGEGMDQYSLFADLCSDPDKVTKLALAQEQVLRATEGGATPDGALYPIRNTLAARISVTPAFYNRTYTAPTLDQAKERLPTLVDYKPYPVGLTGKETPRYGSNGLAFPGRLTLAGGDADVLRDWKAVEEWMVTEGEEGFYRFEEEVGDEHRIEFVK